MGGSVDDFRLQGRHRRADDCCIDSGPLDHCVCGLRKTSILSTQLPPARLKRRVAAPLHSLAAPARTNSAHNVADATALGVNPGFVSAASSPALSAGSLVRGITAFRNLRRQPAGRHTEVQGGCGGGAACVRRRRIRRRPGAGHSTQSLVSPREQRLIPGLGICEGVEMICLPARAASDGGLECGLHSMSLTCDSRCWARRAVGYMICVALCVKRERKNIHAS